MPWRWEPERQCGEAGSSEWVSGRWMHRSADCGEGGRSCVGGFPARALPLPSSGEWGERKGNVWYLCLEWGGVGLAGGGG